jgi:hypothetical protein
VKSTDGEPTSSNLVINKPLKLWGKKIHSELNCNLEIKSSGQDEDSNDSVVVVDIIINGQINITSNNSYKSITLCEVNVLCPAAANGDAVYIGECKGKCFSTVKSSVVVMVYS